MEARDIFLMHHAHLHTVAVGGDRASMEDGLCHGLTAEQYRLRPHGLNSIAWILWHMTRFEDLVVNTVLRGEAEVLDRDGWLERLGIESRLAGTGNTDEEVAGFTRQVDPLQLRAYRAAVGTETRQWAQSANFNALDAVQDVAGRLAQAPTTLDGRASWVPRLWEGRTGHGLLVLPVIDHGFMHIGEGRVTRAMFEKSPR